MARSKKQADGQGSIRYRSDNRWEGRATTGYDKLTGQQIQRSVYGSTQQEVRQKLTAISADLDNREYIPPSQYTVSQWLDCWLENYTGNLKYRTIQNYQKICRLHLIPYIGKIKLSALTPVDVQMLLNRSAKKNCRGNKNKQKQLSPNTVRLIHGTLSKALNCAVQQGLLKTNPAARAVLPKEEKVEIVPLTDAQISDFLKVCATDEYGDILQLILFTGLREGEAAGLCWDCVDFKNSALTINKQLQFRSAKDGGYQFVSTKNGKARTLTAPPFVMQILKRQEEKQILARFAAGEAWQGWQTADEMKTAPVFTRADGQPIALITMYLHFKRIAAQIGAPDARVHDLRHTFAVLSLQNGDDIKTLQTNLGHATAAFTMDVYAHTSDRMKQEAANRMQKYIESIG